MQKISAVIITFNEEDKLRDCLESVKWADEILVVDSYSTDRTIELARTYDARIIQRPFAGYADQKNYAFSQAKHEWIINVDADERITDELRDEILSLLKTGLDKDGYNIYRRNFAFGREVKHGGWEQDMVLRLIRRDVCRYEGRQVHVEISMNTEPGLLKGKMLHYTYASFQEYLEKFRRYIIGGAKDLYNEGRRAHWWNFIINPSWRFLRMYVFRLGFLDGRVGFILAVLSAFYGFLRYAELDRLHREILKRQNAET